jgi:spermidine synthase
LEFVKKAIKENKKWDMVILDYPDFKPDKNDPVNQLFSKEHYQDIKKLLKENGIMTLQATSVLLMPNTFRKLQLIVEDVFESILPYRINVPSFGDIGIIMARIQDKDWRINKEIPEFVFFTKETFANMVLLFQDEKPIFTDEVLQELELWELIDYDLRREKYF